MVTVKLLAVLKELAPNEGCIELKYTPGMTVADALAATNVADTDIKFSVLVNNARKKLDYVIADNDIIKVMPLLAGG